MIVPGTLSITERCVLLPGSLAIVQHSKPFPIVLLSQHYAKQCGRISSSVLTCSGGVDRTDVPDSSLCELIVDSDELARVQRAPARDSITTW